MCYTTFLFSHASGHVIHINAYKNKDHVGVTSIKIIKAFKLDSDTKLSLKAKALLHKLEINPITLNNLPFADPKDTMSLYIKSIGFILQSEMISL